MSDVTPLNQTLNMVQANTFLMGTASAGALSPIEKNTAVLDGPASEDMIAKGLIDKGGQVAQQWQAAVPVLTDPAAVVHVAVTSGAGLRLLHGYLNPALSKNLVGFTPAPEEEYNLTWPLRADHVLAMLVSGLGLDEDIPAQGVTETLSVDAIVALAGFADAIRGIELNNMLARVTDKPEGTDVDQVILSVNEGLFSEDRRWASTLLRDLLPEIPDPKENKMRAGLKELAEIGWLQETREDYWVMTDTGRTVFTHWQMVMASAIFNVEEKNTNTTQKRSYLGMVRTIASIWIVRLVPATEDSNEMMRIDMVSSMDLLELLQKRFKDAFSIEQADTVSDNVTDSCPHCGVSVVPGAKFCSKCGGKL